ncbi:MAG: acyl-ACP--UDP-N-acetylglucosamine O-acyltransferase [Burkholderiaceae bacterium]
MRIHPSALVDPKAQIDSSVEVGPFAIVGPHARIDADCVIAAYATVTGHTTLGKGNRVHSHAVIGGPPQDKKYAGEPTLLEIGDRNTFRESVTVNTGTVQDAGATRIGSDNWVMAYVHVAHDCQIGSHAIMANGVQLAGHVHVGDWAILGGLTGVHQFVKIGAHSMTGAGTVLLQDLPPYVMSQGYPAEPKGLNAEGLRRRGFSPEAINALKQAYKLLYRDGLTFEQAKTSIAAFEAQQAGDAASALSVFSRFLQAVTRGVIR